jgi:PEP-CTERM motif
MIKSIFFIGVALIFSVTLIAHASTTFNYWSPLVSGANLYSSEKRPISDIQLSFIEYVKCNGQPTLHDPILLRFDVPNLTMLAPAASAFSIDPASAPVYDSDFISGKDVYSVLGHNDRTNHSNIFARRSTTDLAINGIADYNFHIFVNDPDNTSKIGSNTEDKSFLSDMPLGKFAIVYGKKSNEIENTGNKTNLTTFTAPFIKPSLPHKVPEPHTLLLFGIGLLGLGFFFRNNFTK